MTIKFDKHRNRNYADRHSLDFPGRISKGVNMFVKRAGKFTRALLEGLNDATFTRLADHPSPDVASEEDDNVTRTIRVLEKQEHLEVVTDDNGDVSLRLTPSGAQLLSIFNQGAQ